MTHTPSAEPPSGRRTIRDTVTDTIAILLVLLLALNATGCGGSDPGTAPGPSYVGSYSLREIDRTALPVEVFNGSARDAADGQWYEQFVVTVRTGAIELDDAGNYHTTYDYTLIRNGASVDRTLEARGTYEVLGDRIYLFRDNGTDNGEGTVENGAITLQLTLMTSEPNQSFTYRK